MKLGLIGAGGFSQFIIEAYKKYLPDLTITSITDLDQKLAQKLADQFSITTVCLSADQLLADKTLNIVAILTPPNTHFELAKKALMAGKNVLVEKPIAFTVAQAQELVQLAEIKNLHLSSNLVLRYHPFHQEIQALVKAKKYGQLRQIITTALLAEYPKEHWYWQPKISGGFFLNTFCHFFDLYDFVIGAEPKKITTRGNINQGLTIVSDYGDKLATLNVNVHVGNDQEKVETTYVFDNAVITCFGWLPEKMVIQLKQGQATEKLSPPKLALYQKVLAEIMSDLIKLITDPRFVSVVNHQILKKTVEHALVAEKSNKYN